jgi:RimJ/RimL family protein N-acetyltransferase
MHILQTERLALRTLEPEDAAFYLELVNDPSWIANIGQRHIHDLDAARAAIEAGARTSQRTNGFSFYLVERRGDGAPIGICGLVKRDSLPHADIGYAFLPAYRGQGYAFEAAAGVLAHARDVLRLDCLLGITAPDNLASNRLLVKLGLRFERVLALPPDGRDTNLYRCDFD